MWDRKAREVQMIFNMSLRYICSALHDSCRRPLRDRQRPLFRLLLRGFDVALQGFWGPFRSATTTVFSMVQSWVNRGDPLLFPQQLSS